jgi:hypothetical protein
MWEYMATLKKRNEMPKTQTKTVLTYTFGQPDRHRQLADLDGTTTSRLTMSEPVVESTQRQPLPARAF